MEKKRYVFVNNLSGWLTFAFALIVYVLTIEPTTSFWDCGEFISTAVKFEVGHPPGAPFFMLVGRFFSLFAFGDVTQMAKMVNIMSATASAFTILFLFWTITHIVRRIFIKTYEMSLAQIAITMGCGLIGGAAYTFSDSFWFSAVEGEVYATSSFFTAIVFWAILKWEEEADQKYANRWIILIAYLMGLSIGVHLLNLLAIPAIIFIYYFRKYETSTKGIILTSILSVVILGGTLWGVIQGVPYFAWGFELMFTNGFGLPYNFGTIFYFLALIAAIIWGILYTRKKGKVLLNTVLTAFATMLIGYSSFAIIVIRSACDPPMDQNNPGNMYSLIGYLNRDQYGDNPLLYGPYFNTPIIGYEEGKTIYAQKDGKYVVVDKEPKYKYESSGMTFFPRMYSHQTELNHEKGYMDWAGLSDKTKKPTFAQNISYFLKYQVWFMYFRYFFWNFVGRQNDMQDAGEIRGNVTEGNWMSGITFIDEWRLGPQDKLSEGLRVNKGKNVYYFLPLLLGIIGMIALYRASKEGKNYFWVLLLFFFFTGLAIVLYVNQPPYQPRERDYSYAGSFYVFAVFIGFGAYAVYELFNKFLSKQILSAAFSIILCFASVPMLMGMQNWDDHDRSNRFTARDVAFNYLNSCAPNAIIFTNGDNDTFPLWYAQEVEGFRTDVRVINLSYLNTEWYIDQMKRKSYKSDPVPFFLTNQHYQKGKLDIVNVVDMTKEYTDLREIIKFVASGDPRARDNRGTSIIPSTQISVVVDSAKVLGNGTVASKYANQLHKYLNWEIKKKYIRKNELMVLDLLATNNWERPIYFATTVGNSNYMGLEKYFQLEGFAYRVVPTYGGVSDGQTGRINTDVLYENMMNKFKWGNVSDPRVYLDENNQRMLMNFKNTFVRLARALLLENKKEKAIEVLDKASSTLPIFLPYSYFNYYNLILMSDVYFQAGADEKGTNLIKKVSDVMLDELNYYLSLPVEYQGTVSEAKERNLAVLGEMFKYLQRNKKTDLQKEIEEKFNQLVAKYGVKTK